MLTCAIAALFACQTSVTATDLAPFTLDLPAGLACTFALHIEGSGGHQNLKEFIDDNGNVVSTLSAGTGSALTFTNVGTGATISFTSNGAVTNATQHADGSQTVEVMGHNVIILFPTDVPAGPSTTLYVGRVVYTVGSDGVFTLVKTSGTATDICAALAA